MNASLPPLSNPDCSYLAGLEAAFVQNRDRFLHEWRQFLAFPSVSSDPDRENDCLQCAQWLVAHLQTIGFHARLLPTHSKPVVFAERPGAPSHPTVLFYGHYDVQPADPLAEWQSPPFTPTLRDDRLYARGASDNKGQIWYAIKAIETLIRSQTLHSPIKILLEGEEEKGSHGLTHALPQWKDILQADILMVTDTGTVPSGAPTLIMGLRGIIHLAVVLSGPKYDLHSGVHGGVAPNPAEAMCRLLASLHRDDGSIAVPDFCAGIQDPSEQERSLANAVPFDPNAYRDDTGVPPLAGEQRFTPAERAGFRPSLTVNGVHSGYTGPGVKTIIPAQSRALITARLVPGQDPAASLDALARHLLQRCPPGLRLDIAEKHVGGPALRLDINSPLIRKARAVLDRLTPHPTVFQWEGASIPVIAELSRVSGAEPLLAGFAGPDDRIHAVNESFSLRQFRLGFLYVASFLASL